MEPATDTTDNHDEADKNKRVCFGDASSTPARAPTALGRARFAATVTIASLPEALQSLAPQRFSDDFLKIKTEILRLEQTKSRLAGDAFIPHSARTKFQLGASTRVQETLQEELEALQGMPETAVGVYQLTCKDYIKRTIVLKIKAAKFELAKRFCTSIGALGIAYAIHTKLIHQIYARELVLLTTDAVEAHHDELLHHSGLTLEEFWTKLKTTTLDLQDIHEVGSIEATTKTTVTPAIPPFKSIIKGCFNRPWDAYLSVCEDNARALEIKKCSDTHLSTAVTATAAMALEDAATDTAGLKELIHVETKKGISAMQKQLNRLTEKSNRMGPKN
jgi:hypothetical protein